MMMMMMRTEALSAKALTSTKAEFLHLRSATLGIFGRPVAQ